MSGVPITVPALPTTPAAPADLVPVWDTSLGVQGKTALSALFAGQVTSDVWVPQLQFGGANVGMTDGGKWGFYIRFGPLVFVTCWIILTAKGSSTGNATVAGLPFASTPGTGRKWILQGQITSPDPSMTGVFHGYIAANNTAISLAQQPFASTFANISNAHFGNTTAIQLSGWYEAP